MSSDHPTVATEFVKEAFETAVPDEEVTQLLGILNGVVSNLRNQLDAGDAGPDPARGTEGGP